MAAWVISLAALWNPILITNDISLPGKIVYGYVFLWYVIATIVFYNFFKRLNLSAIHNKKNIGISSILMLHAIGGFGVFLYITQLAKLLGGYGAVLIAFSQEALILRAASEDAATVGTQFSYLGWIAIFSSIPLIFFSNISKYKKYILVFLALLQLIVNLIYIDRTRPIWIIFVVLLMLLPEIISRKGNIIKFALAAIFGVIGFFFGFALFTGKYNESEGILRNLLIYIVGGFGYFDQLLMNDASVDYIPQRILYPLFKLVSKYSSDLNPPSQVLEFRDIPYPTNVGTFLEPLYSDGGILFVIIGVPLLVFFLNYTSYYALSRGGGSYYGRIFWANICFTFAISFFVPKFVSFPFWMIAAAFILVNFSNRRILKNGIR